MENKLHEELAVLEKNLSDLKGYVEYIESAKKVAETSIEAIETLEKVQEEYIKLKTAVDKLIKKIDEVNFPKRLEDIDLKLSTIIQGITHIQNRLERIFNDLDSLIRENFTSLKSFLEFSFSELNHKITSLSNGVDFINKQLKFNKIFMISSSIVNLILLIIIVYTLIS